MKLDKDLVREILLAVEGSDRLPTGKIDLDLPGRDSNLVSYHIMLLDEAGLLVGRDATTHDGYRWQVRRLTYRGHEFLDTIRDGEIWRKTKAGAEKVGGASIAFLWEIAKQEVKAKLGLP